MPSNKRTTVPRGTSDPIQFLLDNGWTFIGLASEWGFRTTDTIYRLKRFDYPPPPKTAEKMAKTFGWTPGDVINHWLKRAS